MHKNTLKTLSKSVSVKPISSIWRHLFNLCFLRQTIGSYFLHGFSLPNLQINSYYCRPAETAGGTSEHPAHSTSPETAKGHLRNEELQPWRSWIAGHLANKLCLQKEDSGNVAEGSVDHQLYLLWAAIWDSRSVLGTWKSSSRRLSRLITTWRRQKTPCTRLTWRIGMGIIGSKLCTSFYTECSSRASLHKQRTAGRKDSGDVTRNSC